MGLNPAKIAPISELRTYLQRRIWQSKVGMVKIQIKRDENCGWRGEQTQLKLKIATKSILTFHSADAILLLVQMGA